MPNPKCQKCAKTVYPLEAEVLLGLTWHKICFRCTPRRSVLRSVAVA